MKVRVDRRKGRVGFWKSAIERFYDGIKVNKETGCWEWQSTIGSAGYGQFFWDGRKSSPHRFAYMHFVGPIPKGFDLHHKCENTICANPEHLEPMTRSENLKAVYAGRTHCKNGHLLEESNIYKDSRGGEVCRTCRREAFYRHCQRKQKELASC